MQDGKYIHNIVPLLKNGRGKNLIMEWTDLLGKSEQS